MGFGEWFEQLCFGKSLPRVHSCLGLYLSPEVLYLAEIHLSGSRPQVTHLIRLPLSQGTSSKDTKTGGSLNTEFLADTEHLAEVLGKAMEEARCRSKYLTVTLSSDLGILRYFTLPAIDRRFWKTAVPSEAKKFIPIPFASLVHDYQIIQLAPGTDRRPRLGALFGVTDKKNIESLRALAQQLELTLIGVELAPYSVERLWDAVSEEAPGAPYAQIHFDGGQIRILLCERGIPIFFREVFVGREASLMERRKVDLVGCVDFSKKQLGFQGPEKIRVSGQDPNLPAWQEALSQDFGQPVQFQDMDKALGLKGGQWGAYAAIGAALRHLAPRHLVLDLISAGKISDEDKQVAAAILKISAVISVFFLLFGTYYHTQSLYYARSLNQLKQGGAEVFELFRGKTADEIQKTIEDMRNKFGAFGAVTASQLPLTQILQMLAELAPEPVWLTAINYSNPVSFSAQNEQRAITLNGGALASNAAAEQDLAFHFAESLRKTSSFAQTFPSIEPSVDAGERRPEQVGQEGTMTRFIIRCSSAKRPT